MHFNIFFNYILHIVLSLCLALTIISLVALAYNYWTLGVYTDTGAANDVLRPNSLRANMAEGFAWNVMDEKGFNNDKFIKNPDVLIMGPSNIEADQVQRNDSVTNRLAGKLEGLSVYNVGRNGHFLETCVSHLPNAINYFSPRYVAIELFDLHPDPDKMQAVLEGQLNTSVDISKDGKSFKDYLWSYCPATGQLFTQYYFWRDTPFAPDGGV